MIKSNEVAVIVINLNGLHLLNDCLSGLGSQKFKDFDLYFVDNNSADKSVEFVQKNFSSAKIIKLDKNMGFASANNIAIKEALKNPSVKYVVCLNNDTLVEPEWLSEMIRCISSQSKNDNVGMVASKSYLPNGLIQNAGIEIKRNKFNWYVEAVARGANINDQDDSEYNKEGFIFGPSGNSALYTREMLEEVGLFDNDFFAYLEDVDLALRAQNIGYKCLFCPSSKLIHYHSQTSETASPFKAFYSKRNLYLMAIKNFSIMEGLTLPVRDLMVNISRIYNPGNNSVKILKGKVGLASLVFLSFKIVFSILYKIPPMLLKRFNIIKY